MKPELATRLRQVLKGEAILTTGVTGVTGVTDFSGYVSNPLELRQLRGLRRKSTEFQSSAEKGVTRPVASSAEPDIDQDERETIAIEMGGVPVTYAKAFARIQAHPPAEVPGHRWDMFINGAGVFLDGWGQQAARLGWTSENLFGLHPTAGLNRHDVTGLCWLLKGQRVIALTSTEARLSGGLAYYRAAQIPTSFRKPEPHHE